MRSRPARPDQAAGYAVASPVDQTFTVAPAALLTNTITFGAAPTSVTFGEAPGTHSVHATATSGTITYTSLTPSVCTVNATSGALTITGSGPCEIQASETGQAATYAVATPVDQTFTVAPATKVATTITQFSFPGTVVYGNESGEVFSAVVTNTGSKLPTGTVTFMSGSTVLCSTTFLVPFGPHSVAAACFIANTQLPVGTYSVTATYSGDANDLGSTSSPAQRFTVQKDSSTTRVSESATSAASRQREPRDLQRDSHFG